jgi:hypothetical protein
MKVVISTLVLAAVAASCSSNLSTTVRDFIPGKYVRHVSHEMGEEWDTLNISAESTMGNSFKVVRNWKYIRKDGTVQKEKDKIRNAIYDEEKMVLLETKSGRVLSFAPEKKLLFSESSEYEKIK